MLASLVPLYCLFLLCDCVCLLGSAGSAGIGRSECVGFRMGGSCLCMLSLGLVCFRCGVVWCGVVWCGVVCVVVLLVIDI